MDLSRTGGVNPATLKRFLLLSVPMIASQLADSASATLFFSLMSGYSEQHVAAYGVLDALRWTGASISMGLYTAASIRVGTLLGEGKPDCARVAGLAGVSYNLVLGLVPRGLPEAPRRLRSFKNRSPEKSLLGGSGGFPRRPNMD